MSSNPKKLAFLEALELNGTERDAYLSALGARNPGLRRHVERLLAAHEGDGFLDDSGDRGFDQAPEGYRLLRELGEGGAGTVWLAEQEQPVRRRVALKILRRDLTGKEILARFEIERQALAMMDHPCIATIFDAGATSTGRPWFAMEYIDGLTVTEHCDCNCLSLRDRLELAARICDAVHHAHQKGVIHRDLKPSNVLVVDRDGVAQPKVIDFGIAKAAQLRIDSATTQTAAQQLLGTPQYMSPEQAAGGLDVDIRTDVYALGVLIHELLIGVLPFDRDRLRRADLPEILRAIREDEPSRPSSRILRAPREFELSAQARGLGTSELSRSLRGELDWIVLKALEKDRARRYESAAELGRELRRYLDDEPVLARPPERMYVARKFVRRHRRAVLTGALVASVVLAGLVVSTTALRQASRERDRATAALDEAQRRLWEAHLANSHAARASQLPGRRAAALDAVAGAARILPAAELQGEVLAALALVDVEALQTASGYPGAQAQGLHRIDRVATAPRRGLVSVRSTVDGREIARLDRIDLDATSMVFSPAGDYLAVKFDTSGEQRRVVWHLPTDRLVLDQPADALAAEPATFDRRPDGAARWVALPDIDGGINVFDLPGGRLRRRLGAGTRWWAWTSDPSGERLAAVSRFENRLSSWWLEDGTRLMTADTPTSLHSVDWSHDGELLAAGGSDHRAYLLEARTGRVRSILAGHQAQVVSARFSKDDGIVATTSWDGTSRLWNGASGEFLLGPLPDKVIGFGESRLATGRGDSLALWAVGPADGFRVLHAPERFGNIGVVALDRTGRTIVTGGENGVLLWSPDVEGSASSVTDRVPAGVHLLPDGSAIVATFSDGIRRWPLHDGEGFKTIGAVEALWQGSGIRASALTDDGATIIALIDDDVWWIDLVGGRVLRRVKGYEGISGRPSLSPDGRRLATSNWRGDPARVIDVETGRVLRSFEGINVHPRFDPTGQWLAVADGDSLQLHEASALERRFAHDRRNPNQLAGPVAFAPDGAIVAATQAMTSVQLLRSEDGVSLALLDNPYGQRIREMAFSGDGQRVVALTTEGTFFVWDLDVIRARLSALGLARS